MLPSPASRIARDPATDACRRPEASVIRPASQRLRRIVAIARRPSAHGSVESVERVISSISAAPIFGRAGNLRQLRLDERFDGAAQHLRQRIDVAAHQYQREHREDAGEDRSR